MSLQLLKFKKQAICISSLLLSVVALILSFHHRTVFFFTLQQVMKLTEGSRALRLWSEPPISQSMTFYMFNWTNPEEYGVKPPNLKEMGPYKYKMTQKKINIEFNDNDTLTYNVLRHWFFDPEGSVGSDSYPVTTLNPVLTSASHVLRYAGYFPQKALGFAVRTFNVKQYMTKSIREFIFSGINDPLISAAPYFKSFSHVDVPFDKFAWFYDEGTYNVGTGRHSLRDLSKIHGWDWESRTAYFEGDCGMVNGSSGEFFPQQLTKSDVLEFFLPDFCRSVKLRFEEEVVIHGVPGYKFVADHRMVDNGTYDQSNRCFCGGECSPVGVLNVTACRYGAPGFTSFPHFLHGDEYYLNSVEGMSPDKTKHNFYITVEPNTGITLDVTMRLQANLLTMPHKHIGILANAPRLYFPVLWSEAKAIIPKNLALELQLGLLVLHYGSPVLLGLAIVFSIPVIAILVRKDEKKLHRLTLPAFLMQPLLVEKR